MYYLGANPIDDIAEVIQTLRKDTSGRLDKYKNILNEEKARLSKLVELKSSKQEQNTTHYIPYVLGAVAVVGAAYFLTQKKK